MRAPGLLVTACAAATLIAPTNARAQETGGVTEVGWWSQRPGASEQPEGGFEVAAGLGTDQSVAALRVSVPENTTSATLMLTESGGFGRDDAALRVCTTASAWEPANPGAWEETPEPDCSAEVPLQPDTDTTWAGDVTSLATNGGSLMVLPGSPDDPDGGVPVGPSFQLTFSGAQLQVVTASAAPAPGTVTADTGAGATYDPQPAPVSTASSSPAGAPADGGAASDFSVPPSDAPTTPVEREVRIEVDAEGDAPSGASAADTPLGAAGPVDSSGDGGRPWARLIALVPFSAAIGLAVARGRRYAADRGLPVGD